jgi:hypothetical protein
LGPWKDPTILSHVISFFYISVKGKRLFLGLETISSCIF